ncbi:MAG: sialidase family protein, partial [Patescibacteria group bacterium]|nr:sialidase family protein [Patescibacteria group bacterium]
MSTLCFALCYALAAAGPMPVGGAYGEPRLLVPAPEDPAMAHLSWPKVVTAGDGTLVLACCAGRGHNMGGSGPFVSRSTDGGATFSRPVRLAYFPDDDPRYRDCGNVALGLAEDGAVVLLAMAFAPSQNTILGWRSTDAGATWRPMDTSALAENKTGSVYGHILQVPGLGLVVFGHYRKPSVPDVGVWMSVSTDGGQRWGKPQVVTEKAYYEPAFTFAEGRFVGLLRLARGADARRYDEAVSDDLGKTWRIRPSTIAIPEGLRGMQPSPFISVSPTEPGKLYALQSIRGSFEQTRGRVYLWTADAKQLQWKREGLVAS